VLVRDKQGNKLDILRNHRYVITITGVTGPGADTWEEAMVGPAYVQATVTPWNNAEQNVLFDGTNLMIVQEKDFTLYREAGSTQIDAGAFIADGGNANGLKWSLDTGDATSSDIWATVTSQTSEYVTDAVGQMGAEGTVYNLTLNIAWAENAELDYDATLTFKAGNMSYVVKIHHSTDSWITFDTESYYLLDGKFHEMGVTASDEWRLISTYDGGTNSVSWATFVSGDDLVSAFDPVGAESDAVADKVIFSTTECDPADDEVGTIRLTFTNDSRNYANKTVDICLASGTALAEANTYIMQAGSHEALIFPLRSYDDTFAASDTYTPAYVWTYEFDQTTSLSGAIGIIATMDVIGTKEPYLRVRGGDYIGNTVVAVKNAAEDIIWSWHIWSVDDKEVLEAGRPGAGGLTWMDRDLGAMSGAYTDYDNGPTTGVYYQAGRKDAFPCLVLYRYLTYEASTDAFSEDGIITENMGTMSRQDALLYSMENPLSVLVADTPYAWSQSWNTGTAASKTKFDPCPPEWRAATSNLYYYSNSADGSFSSGEWGLSNLIRWEYNIASGARLENHGGFYVNMPEANANSLQYQNMNYHTLWTATMEEEEGNITNFDAVNIFFDTDTDDVNVSSAEPFLVPLDDPDLKYVRCVKG
jgi:hypothetical protein